MKITELLTKETVLLSIAGNEKHAVINELVDLLDQAGKLSDREHFKTAILNREEQGSTGFRNGIAIPHAKDYSVKKAAIAFGKSRTGVNFGAIDGQPSHMFFMIAAPERANQIHLEVLSRLATILMKEEVRQKLIAASTVDDILNTIDYFDDEGEDKEEVPIRDQKRFIVAVTSCPTGIAHTYMAADSLKAKAKELGVEIKIETNGASGAKDILTNEDIEKAVAVIITADTRVEMERFKGKYVIETSVAAGIRKPGYLIKRALIQDATLYKGLDERKSSLFSIKGNRMGIRASIYKHIMNGVSNMLPFAVGGGILIAISLWLDDHSPYLSYKTFAATLIEIGGGNAFALLVPVLSGFIAMSIADRPGLAPGMISGMMAVSGDAGFLGGLIGGLLGGYSVRGLKNILMKCPTSLEGIKVILFYPLLGMTITGFAMKYVINGPVAGVNRAITEWVSTLGIVSAGLLGMVLGMMMAFDMGGPVNKTAYLFGIGLLVNGVYEPMAAIMAAGMVPPLAIAFATTLFKSHFPKKDQIAGKANYMKGLSFISEGVLPFAAADPMRVIPSVMVGSAIAGAISMIAGIGLPVPHGGVFVIPLIEGNWAIYVSGIIMGAVFSALILGFLKRPL